MSGHREGLGQYDSWMWPWASESVARAERGDPEGCRERGDHRGCREREGTGRAQGGCRGVSMRVTRVQRQGCSAIRGARITGTSFRREMQAVNEGMDEAA